MLSLRTAEIATEIEEVVLNSGQDIANIDIGNMQHRNADDRVRLVNAAVGRHADVEFGQPRPVTKRRTAVVAGARVDPIEFHGGVPVRSSGLLDPARELCQRHSAISRICSSCIPLPRSRFASDSVRGKLALRMRMTVINVTPTSS